MTSVNPYQSPPESEERLLDAAVSEDRVRTIGEMLILWEKLRLAYNAILSLIVIGFVVFSFRGSLLSISLLAPLVVLAIAANLCFCAGPTVVAYLCWAGAPPPVARTTTYILFTLGTVLASMLAVSVMLSL